MPRQKWPRMKTYAILCVALCIAAAACGRSLSPPTLAPLPFPTDTLRVERVAEGVWHRYLYAPGGPWAIHVLDVNLSRCNEIVAVKGADSATGLTKTTELLEWLDGQTKRNLVITFGGGVNEVMREMIAASGLGVPRVPR